METRRMPFRAGHRVIAEHSFETRAEMDAAIDEAMRPREITEAQEPTPIILYLSDELTIASLVELVNRYGGVANDRIL